MNYYGRFANFSVEPSDPVCSIQVESYLRELSGVIRNMPTRYVLVYKVSYFIKFYHFLVEYFRTMLSGIWCIIFCNTSANPLEISAMILCVH